MTAAQAMPDQDSVTVAIDIAASPEQVFRALTDQKQLFTWWGKEPSVELLTFEMDARPGGKWRFRCQAKAGSDHGDVGKQLQRNQAQEFEAYGEILEYVPPRLLVWSWVANWHQDPNLPTTVRWELMPIPGGTRVQVTHTGLAHEPVSRKDYGSGWESVLRLLKSYL